MSFDLLLTDEAVCLDKAPGDPKAKVVKCDSPQAAYQLVGKGTPISAEDAAKFGVKTTKADASNYTLRLDGSTIARTPEDRKYAMTLPQPGLVAAQAENIRSAAALSVASLHTAAQAQSADADAEAKKADAAAEKTLKASLESKAAKSPRKAARAKKPTKKEAAATKKEAAAAANG